MHKTKLGGLLLIGVALWACRDPEDIITLRPVPVLRAPGSANIGDKVLFDASESYDDDGYITQYVFRLGMAGMGHVSASPLFEYAFQTPGVKTIQLVVIDNVGAKGALQVQMLIEDPTGIWDAGARPDVGQPDTQDVAVDVAPDVVVDVAPETISGPDGHVAEVSDVVIDSRDTAVADTGPLDTGGLDLGPGVCVDIAGNYTLVSECPSDPGPSPGIPVTVAQQACDVEVPELAVSGFIDPNAQELWLGTPTEPTPWGVCIGPVAAGEAFELQCETGCSLFFAPM